MTTKRSGRGVAALFPLPFVIPSSAPSVLFSKLFRRGENAPFTCPARTKAGRGARSKPRPGQRLKSQPKAGRRPATAVGVLPAGASPQSGIFPARQMRSGNKPELRCGSDDKAKRARRSRADPLPFVIPSSAPSGLFLKLFKRGKKAPDAASRKK